MKVQILMSTYNGEKYLREQLDSILAQKTVLKGKEKNSRETIDISLFIRDDGSTDGTVDILEEYYRKYPKITYIRGRNKGACQSFFELLQKADKDADYIAFSDQDDVWNENKIRRAVGSLLKYQEIPAMYAGDLEIVNENLETIRISENTDDGFRPSFGNALIENICTGCTIVINKKLYDMVVRELPKHAYMHDWWLYMTASCFGKVLYDRETFIKYRQHGENTVGSAVCYSQLIKKRIGNFHDLKNYVPAQIREFLEIFQPSGENRRLIHQMLLGRGCCRERLGIFGCRRIRRRKAVDTVLYKLGYLFW